MQESNFQQVSLVLDALNCGAMLVERSGRVAHANPIMADMVGLSASDLVGRNVHEFYSSAEDHERLDQALKAFDEPMVGDFHIERPDGTRIEAIFSGRRLTGPDPLPAYRVITAVDISAQKHAEERYRSLYSEMAKLSDTVIEQALALKDYSKTLERRVRERTTELNEANMDAILMLAEASEAKDDDTGAHVRRIQHYSQAIARELGLNDQLAERIGYSAILHDVGKIHIPDEILRKPGPLTHEERRIIETHTVVGERILSRKRFFNTAREIARSHHENWDGSGYPDGLAGGSIPLGARIVRVADVFDALVHARPYKAAWSIEDTTRHLRENRGRLLDTDVVDAFERLLATGLFESIVRPLVLAQAAKEGQKAIGGP